MVAALALALGLAEVGARVWSWARPVTSLRGLHVYRPDRPWLYGLRPGTVGRLPVSGTTLYEINADGFRGPVQVRPKPPGRFRVVILGDSIAFGYGVEEAAAFPRVLESELARRAPGSNVDVVNLGVGGYNAWNEARVLEDVGVSYDPDLVLVQFCINDLNDPTVHFDGQTRLVLAAIPEAAFPNPAVRRDPRPAPSHLNAACSHSQLCVMARSFWRARFDRSPDDDDVADRSAFEPVESDAGPEWRWLERNYMDMASIANQRGARFGIVMIPYPGQVRRPATDPAGELMGAMARRHGWTLIDPVAAFRAADSDASRLFIDQWHPTPAGHRILADETIRSLACSGGLGAQARGAC